MNRKSKSNPNPLKVFHLITSLEVGGTQNGLLVNLPKMPRQSFRNIVCSVTSGSTLSGAFRDRDICSYSLDMTNKFDLFALSRLIKILEKEKPNILHTYLFHANFIGTLAGKFARVPIIVNSERIVPNKGIHRRVLSRALNKITHAIETNSQANKCYISRNHKINKEKISVILPGFESNDFNDDKRVSYRKMLGISPTEYLVGCFGRLNEQKGFEFAIQAIDEMRSMDPKIKLIIVGEGPERYFLMNMVTSLELTNKVMFLGERTDVKELMCSTDMIFVPSRYEGLPRVVLEGMMAGRPIVATDVGGVSEVIEDNVNGVLVLPNNVESMVSGLFKVLRDSDFANSIAKAGLCYARVNFNQNRYLEDLQNFYVGLMEKYCSEI